MKYNMSSRDFVKLEKSWNVSQRIMLSLPRNAHRYLIEPLSRKQHIIKSLKKRFISFISKLRSSRKRVLGNVLRTIEFDCRSTTGLNIRNMRLQCQNFGTDEFDFDSTPYFIISEDNKWRLDIIQEIIEIKSGALKVVDFSYKDLDYICEIVSSS